MGIVSFGIDTGGIRVLADVRAQYRWQWDAEDRAQIRAGISIGFNDEDEARRPSATTASR